MLEAVYDGWGDHPGPQFGRPAAVIGTDPGFGQVVARQSFRIVEDIFAACNVIVADQPAPHVTVIIRVGAVHHAMPLTAITVAEIAPFTPFPARKPLVERGCLAVHRVLVG